VPLRRSSSSFVDLPKRVDGHAANVPSRGVGAAAFDVRGNVRIVEGRRFVPAAPR